MCFNRSVRLFQPFLIFAKVSDETNVSTCVPCWVCIKKKYKPIELYENDENTIKCTQKKTVVFAKRTETVIVNANA